MIWKTHFSWRQLFLKLAGTEDNTNIFTVTAGPLPSHFRSIKMAMDKPLLEPEEDLLPRQNFRRRVLLATTAVLVTLCLAGIISVCILRVGKDYTEKTKVVNSTVDKDIYVSEVVGVRYGVDGDANNENEVVKAEIVEFSSLLKSRTKCIKRCRKYYHPRFQSRCSYGYCVCDGPNYNPLTCLPEVSGCIMEKAIERKNSQASMENEMQTVYECVNSSYSHRETDAHVISIRGNHYVSHTTVNITSDSLKGLTLVLASSFPVRWRIQLQQNTSIEEIILICQRGFHRSNVELIDDDGSDVIPIMFSKLYSVVGFGDDSVGGNTLDLIDTINTFVGPIKSFRGAAYADSWTVTL